MTSPLPSAPALTAHFVPRWPSNPYHAELAEHLADCGVVVGKESQLKDIYQSVVATGKKPDLVHLHAVPRFGLSPVSALRFFAFFRRVRALQKCGVRAVWTIHDSSHHEAGYPAIERYFSRLLYRRVDATIVHSDGAARTVERQWGVKRDERMFIIPHGHYIGSYPNEIGRAEARKELGIPSGKLVYLFLGMIRPYKGVTDLIRAFKSLAAPETHLLIAGKPISEELSGEIRSEMGDRSDIEYAPGHVDDAALQLYLNAADVVVFPYTRALTSGALILAMSFRRACIAPRLGALEDTLDEQGGFFFSPSEQGALLEAMKRAARMRDKLDEMGEHNRLKAEAWPWSDVAARTAEVYRNGGKGKID